MIIITDIINFLLILFENLYFYKKYKFSFKNKFNHIFNLKKCISVEIVKYLCLIKLRFFHTFNRVFNKNTTVLTIYTQSFYDFYVELLKRC